MTNVLNIPSRLARLTAATIATIACVATLGLADLQVPGVAGVTTPSASALVYEGEIAMGPRVERAGGSYYDYRSTWVRSTGYQGYAMDWVGAGAHVPGGWTMYGSYVVGWIESCHVYAANNNLGAMIINWSYSLSQSIVAYSNWPYC